jgi:adenine/guanine/hypoxanthine permease
MSNIPLSPNGNKIPFFKKADADACVGVFFDGFTKVIAGVGIMTGVLGLSGDTVFKRIMPGIGLAVLLYGIYMWWEGYTLAKAQNNPDIVALPGGLVAGRFFVWLFAIMGPTFWATKNATLAWQVGLWAQLIGGVVFIIAAYIAPFMLKVLPKAALFGSLAGGALAWLFLGPIGDLFSKPVVGFVSLFIVLILYAGNFKVKFPVAILAIGAGTIIAWVTGVMEPKNVTDSFANLGANIPLPTFNFLNGEALKYTLSNFMPIIIVFSFGEVISAIQGIEQAKMGGDVYNEKRVIIMTSVISMISAFFGNPFPMGVYWGHVGWKKIKAGTGYMLGVGGLYFVLCVTGLVAIATSVIPVESTLPMLIFIALASTAQAFEVCGTKYLSAAALGMAVPIVEILWGKITSAAGLLADWTPEMLSGQGISLGYLTISQGSAFTGIIWAAVICFTIDNKWKNAAITSMIGAALAFLGIINSKEIKLLANPTFTYLYIGLAVLFILLHFMKVNNLQVEEQK